MSSSRAGRPPETAPPGSSFPCLAPGVELLGEYDGSGCHEPPHLVRRRDGRTFGISPLLGAVAAQLAKDRPASVVASRVGAELGRTMTAHDVDYLVEQKLRPLGVLEGDEFPAKASPPAALLALTLRGGVIPSGVIQPATRLLQPLFALPVVLVSLAGLAAVDARLLPGHHLSGAAREIATHPAWVLAIIGLTLLGGLLHELGHATATRFGGATPGGIGIGIYLLWPVFYNDLSDSYRLNRRGRLRADLGGIYFNVLFTLAVAAAYGVSGAAPLLIVIVIQHFTIAQQCLPFVRLDGYYVVSDLVGVPDLFGRVRPILASFLPGRRRPREVADLKTAARVAVTIWVLVTVPALLAVAALLLISLPGLLAGGSHSLGIHATALRSALRGGDAIGTLLQAVQVLVLAIPFIGMAALLGRIGGRAWGFLRVGRKRLRRFDRLGTSDRRS